MCIYIYIHIWGWRGWLGSSILRQTQIWASLKIGNAMDSEWLSRKHRRTRFFFAIDTKRPEKIQEVQWEFHMTCVNPQGDGPVSGWSITFGCLVFSGFPLKSSCPSLGFCPRCHRWMEVLGFSGTAQRPWDIQNEEASNIFPGDAVRVRRIAKVEQADLVWTFWDRVKTLPKPFQIPLLNGNTRGSDPKKEGIWVHSHTHTGQLTRGVLTQWSGELRQLRLAFGGCRQARTWEKDIL